MKSGTSQKLICDMISTTVMCRLGRVEGNRMIHAHRTVHKVVDRLTRTMVERNPSLEYDTCEDANQKIRRAYGSGSRATQGRNPEERTNGSQLTYGIQHNNFILNHSSVAAGCDSSQNGEDDVNAFKGVVINEIRRP